MPYKNDEQHFIKEKIKDKPVNKKQLLHKGMATIGYAILFGFVSCLVFCALQPKIESWFASKEDQWVGIPKDTLSDEENEADTQADTEQEASLDDKEPEKKDEKQKTVYITEKKEMTLNDYQVLQNQLYQIGNEVNKSIVTVTGVHEGVDIFDSPYEATGQASGLIIGNNKKELLVLTEYQVIEDVKSIRVTFINNDTQNATLKKYDGNTGIAVLGVPVEKIAKATMNQIETAILGNSLNLRQGKLVVALGSPLGTNYSILTGNITSVANTITTDDRNYTVFTTNIVANTKGNGVLVNTDGEVIGLFLKSSNFQKEQNTLTAVSISELKDIIELLSNGLNVPYIGIRGSTVTDAISEEYDIPKGVYVKEAVVDSPAMTAGLQTGDVIVAINKEEVSSMRDYQQILLKLKKGEEVKITANRQNAQGYKKFTCTVEVGVLR
ncbi:MAG: S1C family serine protease [Eubacterium sp.]|nr:S1C family serine protease [Eubacterium sp.]